MKFKFNGQEYYIDKLKLALPLATIVYNLKKDWDFIILITGDRTVRTGKSVLGLTIGAFLSVLLNEIGIKTNFSLDTVFFDSKKMVNDSLKLTHSIIMYDEGRDSLATTKMFTPPQQKLLDYYAECGQSNNIFIIILPDYFNLIENIAIARSELLLNVYRTETKIMTNVFSNAFGNKKIPVTRFDRGRFELFNRYTKQKLYDKSKKTRKKSYGLIKATGIGRFVNQYPLDEVKYKKMKLEWFKRFDKRKKEQLKIMKTDVFRDKVIMELHKAKKNSKEIANYLAKHYKYQITDSGIRRIIGRITKTHKIGGDLDVT